MKLEVYNTYVVSNANDRMHFDVLLPQGSALEAAENYAMLWLNSIGVGGATPRTPRSISARMKEQKCGHAA